jgi:hypothetical protein
MPKSYRIRTQPGVDKSIQIKLDQDFEFLEILSLKILQSDIYTRLCSDYGVVVGRVLTNGGTGLPNAKVSVFIPISEVDQQNPIISELYPYTSLEDLNVDGYRYNLLPYKPSYTGHAATGTFPERDDILTDFSLVEVYNNYYKFTTKTNESGDYMIFGVPTGSQTIVMDVDLSDIGCFSLTPQDLINSGVAGEGQFDGNKFKTSSNLRELPQIINLNKIVEVQPLWGEPEVCLLGITRVDFDLTASSNINIQPTSVFMGSVISTANEDSLKKSCKPKLNTGNMCDLVAGPGQILAIRQTINVDANGDPVLETYKIEQDGKIIDGDGTWLINLPMNLDYITTNEFGEQVISNNPKIGIPTKAKYRFKVKWQNEQGLQNNFMRANYLIPNVKEHGWNSNDEDTDPFDPSLGSVYPLYIPVGSTQMLQIFPKGGLIYNSSVNSNDLSVLIGGVPYYGSLDSIPLTGATNIVTLISNAIDVTQQQTFYFTFLQDPYFTVLKSYAFSLDWDDYYDKVSAINCEDTFYEFNYNKVYTIASFIDRYKNGRNRARHLGIKEITDRSCQSENNKMPVNDVVRNFDFLFFLFSLLIAILSPVLAIVIVFNHVLAWIYPIIVKINNFIIKIVNGLIYELCKGLNALRTAANKKDCNKDQLESMSDENPFKRLSLPMLTYPDCEACSCEDKGLVTENSVADGLNAAALSVNLSLLSDLGSIDSYSSFSYPSSILPCNLATISPAPDQTTWDQGLQQIFAGILNPAQTYYKVPIWEEVGPNGSGNSGEFFKRFGDGMTLAQSMNMANLRARYSDPTARNRITITPNPSLVGATTLGVNGNSYQDLSMIILVDEGTTSQLTGNLITFNNPALNSDTNTTGGTVNQFDGNGITGTTLGIGTYMVPITYMDEFGFDIQSNITVVSTESEKEYLYKSGLEYFQVITGYTWGQLTTSGGPFEPQGIYNVGLQDVTSSGVLYKYFLQNKISYIDASAGSHSPPWYWFSEYEQQEILILVRGVDPYTEKQEIKYDLSELFGQLPDTTTVTGEYFLNIPIQQNDGGSYSNSFRTPQTHANVNDNSNTYLFHEPIGFTADTAAFTAFTTDSPQYYTSTDRSTLNYIHNSFDSGILMSSWIDPDGRITNGNGPSQNFRWVSTVGPSSDILIEYIGWVDGGSFTVTNGTKYTCYDGGLGTLNSLFGYPVFTPTSPLARCYAPAYNIEENGNVPTPTNMNLSQNLIFRSDRLPTSDQTDTVGYNSFPLHQNNNFSFYTISPEGGVVNYNISAGGVAGFNDLDAIGDLGTGNTANLVNTFSCEGMVPLGCYSGSGTDFGVEDPCTDNQTGKDGQNQRVYNGCYYFVDDKLIKTIKDDLKFLAEWKTRFRIIFAACRGVFGHMFQNNWINGVLYMPSFNKQTTYDIVGIPSYRYCNDVVLFNDISNNFYYRSSPYADDIDQFIGAPRPTASNLLNISFSSGSDNSANSRQILFPTTIMDLGNRDEFIAEVCGDPDFAGRYLGNTFKSTSYQDSSDLLQMAIISRIVNSTFLQQVLAIQEGGIEQFFTREGDRIDGDIAQSFSINSEYQVTPFIGGNYDDNFVYVGSDSSNEPVFGIFYVSDENEYKNRRALSPGINIYSFSTSPPLQTPYGYPSTQEVPLYKWQISPNNTIFGNQTNEWYTTSDGNVTTNGFYSQKYQSLDAVNDDYFKTFIMSPTYPNIFYGYITNFDQTTPPTPVTPQPDPSLIANPVVVGAPNYFYFGLKNGKTALNRFIKIYIDTTAE